MSLAKAFETLMTLNFHHMLVMESVGSFLSFNMNIIGLPMMTPVY